MAARRFGANVSEQSAPVKARSAGQWWVGANGKPYGPYSMAQLSRFVAEGRVRASTQVAESAEGPWVDARKVMGLLGPTGGENDNAPDAANIFVHAEIRSGAHHEFAAALEALGSMCELAPGLFLVRTRFSAGIVRNTLSQTLMAGDRFAVIDATRNRFAWFNLGPEIDARVSSVWNGPLRADAL